MNLCNITKIHIGTIIIHTPSISTVDKLKLLNVSEGLMFLDLNCNKMVLSSP